MTWRQLNDPTNRENRNAGNGGDLVKHTVYLTVLDYLLANDPWSNETRVRECHAGRGMYLIPHDDRGRRPLLECLYEPVDADVGVLLHDVQRASQGALGTWLADRETFGWYSGSAVLNAWRLGAVREGCHQLHLYEMAPDTRQVLRSLFGVRALQFPQLKVHIYPDPEDQQDFDGELHIEQNVSAWNCQDLVLLDPFAMWRQNQDQVRRDRYRRIIEQLIAREQDSPSLVLFWTWGRAFPVADGDLAGTSVPASNGYQELRDLLHQAERHFIRVTWRWGLQFAMWVSVQDSHLMPLCAALQDRCAALRTHLEQQGFRGRLAHPSIEIGLD